MAQKASKQWDGYILLAGTTNSPKYTSVSDKKRSNGSFLDGLSMDLHHMKKEAGRNLITVVQDMQFLSKHTVLDRIKRCALKVSKFGTYHIYYTGHGETNTGNWCFADGTVSFDEVINAVKSVNDGCFIEIIADCCYSGNWVQGLKKYKGKLESVLVSAACLPGTVAFDTKDGGMYTLCRTGVKRDFRDFKEFVSCHARLYNGKYTITRIMPSLMDRNSFDALVDEYLHYFRYPNRFDPI